MPTKATRLDAGAGAAVSPAPRPSLQLLPYLLLLPSLAIIFLIEFYPFLKGVSFSFHKGNLLGLGAFVGFDNYLRMFRSPSFINSLWFSFVFAFFNVLISYVLGLALALFLNLDCPGGGLNCELEMVNRGPRGTSEHHLELVWCGSDLFPEPERLGRSGGNRNQDLAEFSLHDAKPARAIAGD